MNKFLTATLLATAAISAPAYAQSADHVGGYVQVRAGLADINNPKLNYVQDPTDEESNEFAAQGNQKSTATLGGEIGYDFGPVRLGVELAYNRNKINELTFNSANGTTLTEANFDDFVEDFLGYDEEEQEAFAISGTSMRLKGGSIAKNRQLAVMANVTYDVPVDGAIQPYIGAGLGGVSSRLSAFGENDSEFKFAWQVRAGAAYVVSDNFAITADYTYRQSGKTSYSFDDTEAFKLNRSKVSLFQLGLRAGF